MKRLAKALLLLVLCTSVGCGEASTRAARGGVDPRLVPPPAPAVAPTPTPAGPKASYALNEWANVANLRVRVTEVSQKDVSELNERPDRAVMFEGCVQSGTYVFERDDFAASGSGYAQFRSARSSFRDFPSPRFPFGEGRMRAGDCAKGWVVFDTTADARLSNVAFAASRDHTAVWVFG